MFHQFECQQIPKAEARVCGLLAGVVVLNFAFGAALQSAPAPTNEQRSTSQDLYPWSTAQQRTVDESQLFAALQGAKVVILGEVHDNAIHHQLRARIVTEIARRRLTANPEALLPAAVFEHVTKDRQSDLDRVVEAGSNSSVDDAVDEFFRAADWKKRGWPDQTMFRPLVGAVLAAGLPLYAGDVPRKMIRSVAMAGPHKMTARERRRLKLGGSLGADHDTALLAEIEASHCGLMPKAALAPMAFAQRLRDATLADVTLAAVDWQGSAILFAGNGHVRKDRGVPWYLAARGMGDVVTVVFKEWPPSEAPIATGEAHSARQQDPASGEQSPPPAPAISDYVVWTTPTTRPDPCQEMRKKYGKTKR